MLSNFYFPILFPFWVTNYVGLEIPLSQEFYLFLLELFMRPSEVAFINENFSKRCKPATEYGFLRMCL